MEFNCLGKFDPDAPIDNAIVAKAIELIKYLPDLPNGYRLKREYDHWTVGHYNQDFKDYTICVRNSDGHFYFDITHSPIDNSVDDNGNIYSPEGYAAHTYHRNSGAVGVSTDDMVFATEHDFGPEPTSIEAIEYLCAAGAALAIKYDIDLSALSTYEPYKDEPVSMTHAEAAILVGNPKQYDNYGVDGTEERWDYGTLVVLPEGVKLTVDMVKKTGDALRSRKHKYKLAILESIKHG